MQNNQKGNNLSFYNIIMLVSMAFSVTFGLGACNPKPKEVTLPFETIEQTDWAGTEKPYESREPSMIIVSLPEEVDNLSGFISEESKAKLQALDYSSHFAILVLQGWKPTTGYKVNVVRVSRLKDIVNVYADFVEPKPNEEKGNLVTSPYHLIQIPKTERWGQDITFTLVVSETTVISLSHNIP